MPFSRAGADRTLKRPPPLRRLFSWQVGLFALALFVGFFLYVVFPEPPVTRGDVPPAVLYDEGRRMARTALRMTVYSPRKLELLLGAVLYLEILQQVKPDLGGMEDARLLLARTYYELGLVAAARPEVARRERLQSPDACFRIALSMLNEVARLYESDTAEGVEARLFAARSLLRLNRPQDVPELLAPIVERFRRRGITQLEAERRDVVTWGEQFGALPWDEAALLANARAVRAQGQRDEALALAREFLPGVHGLSVRQGMLEIALSECLARRDRQAVGELLDLLDTPLPPELCDLGVVCMIYAGRPDEALKVLKGPQAAAAIPQFRKALLEAFAGSGAGRAGAAQEAADRLPVERLSPVEQAVRLMVLVRAAVSEGAADPAAEAFSQLVAVSETVGRTEDPLAAFLDAGELAKLAEGTAELLRRNNRRAEAAELYILVSRLAPQAGIELLEKAAFLYEQEAVSSGQPRFWEQAARALEDVLDQHPPAPYYEKILWRALEDWQGEKEERAGRPFNFIVLAEKALDEVPGLESAPKVLLHLAGVYTRVGLLDSALEKIEQLLRVYPFSAFAVSGMLEEGRLLERLGRQDDALVAYRRILRDARLGPDAFVYAAALHELGLLEAAQAERGFDSGRMADGRYEPGSGLEPSLYKRARERLLEALERYGGPRYSGYPVFREYLRRKRPAVWEALMRLELLAVFGKGAEASVTAAGWYEQFSELVANALRDLERRHSADVEAKGRFLLYRGLAAFHAASMQPAEAPIMLEKARQDFTGGAEYYDRKPEGLFARLAALTTLRELGASGDVVMKAQINAEWAEEALSADDLERARFWSQALAWIKQMEPLPARGGR